MKKRREKKRVAFLATAVMSAAVLPAYASGTGTNEPSMDLNVSKASVYTMSIPKAQNTITFGAEDTVIGDLSVTGDIGTKQQVQVTVSKTDFVDKTDAANKFSFELLHQGKAFAGQTWDCEQVRGAVAVKYPLTVHIPGETWANVAAGEYAATLVFQAELKNVQ